AVVLRVCRFIVGMNDAEDAWMDTFISAMRAYPDLPLDANVQAWLVRIAHNRSIDLVRNRGRQPIPIADLPDRIDDLGQSSGERHDIWILVGELPPKQRQAIAYHYLGGLPFREVAAILGGTPEAARKAASDGVKALRITINPAQRKQTA
ncbi:MAG TPA: RNA polymerase subunit sigma-24, partial [Actinobacteria bacterium]|nr:RNA polymerase subunit sigma-24 [Actinomycetota bacterium]